MRLHISYFACLLLGPLSAGAVAAELSTGSLLQDYGVTADQLPAPAKTEVIKLKPEPSRFPMTPEKPMVKFHLADKPKPEITGNPSIDNLNARQVDECLRAFRGNPIACGQNPAVQSEQ
ncbi:hypothetical protein [Pseudomonas caspiana]|uniref:hypothetical protein n=1 Tax=Pseudomonas caspiana TaxID=1451454 RepID=UPI0011981FD3|nr:hypothetical protein [Pseudomonas caspiana]